MKESTDVALFSRPHQRGKSLIRRNNRRRLWQYTEEFPSSSWVCSRCRVTWSDDRDTAKWDGLNKKWCNGFPHLSTDHPLVDLAYLQSTTHIFTNRLLITRPRVILLKHTSGGSLLQTLQHLHTQTPRDPVLWCKCSTSCSELLSIEHFTSDLLANSTLKINLTQLDTEQSAGTQMLSTPPQLCGWWKIFTLTQFFFEPRMNRNYTYRIQRWHTP